MELEEKLDILALSPDQREIAKKRFLATLALVSKEELNEIKNYLYTEGIVISKAREIKIFANSIEEIAKKISILGEIHEVYMYTQEPLMINKNVIDIYKKLQYCKQNNIPYKREDGTYESFLFSELAWQKEMNRTPIVKEEIVENVETPVEDFVTLEPAIEPTLEIDEPISFVEPEEINDAPMQNNHVDIKEYMSISEDEKELEAKTTSFANIRQNLEEQLALLDDLKSSNFEEEIGFNDLEPESFGMGRAA